MFKKIIREPIFHFLIAGFLLYIIYQYFNPEPAIRHSDNTIVVTDAVLKNLLNIRSKNPEGQFNVDAALAALDTSEKDALAAEYIEEEALYRMALEMKLNNDDFIIKRRMIQKLLFLLEDLNTIEIDTSDDKLKAYYDANHNEFKTDDRVSFTHVYLSSDHHGETTLTKAEQLIKRLNDEASGNNDAVSAGDRFPLNHSYTKITPTQTRSNFGIRFSEALFQLDKQDEWQGPVESGYGYHLVKISYKEPGYIPTFDSIRDFVESAYTYREKQRLNKLTRDHVIEKFTVRREYE